MDKPFHSFCIIADDLSGAADCAAAFAAMAGPVPVALGTAAMDGPCLALDTDSRSMDQAAAVAATIQACEQVAGGAWQLIYKKIDSTLRGHVAAELAAALRALPQCAGAIVAPAFPQQGRTLVNGRLLVQGQPAAGESRDLPALLASAGLRPSLLGTGAVALGPAIDQALAGGARAIVVDAVGQSDLDRLADALCRPGAPALLAVGSAGLARSLATHLPPGTRQPDSAPAAAGPVLAVVGSFAAASAAQVREVEASGDAQVLRLTAVQWLEQQHAELRRSTVDRARDALGNGRHVVLAIAGTVVQPFTRALVEAIAAAAAPLLGQAGTCVLTGGDTARALFNQLGIQRFDILGEVEPGISIGRDSGHPATRFILKAGGFGDPFALQRLVRQSGRPSHARIAAPT